LERARKNLQSERRMLMTSAEEHRRLLQAFVKAATEGDVAGLTQLLAPDAVLISDGGPEGRVIAGQRNLRQPLEGAERIATFVAHTSKRGVELARVEERRLNGQPAIVLFDGDQPVAAIQLAVADGKIQRIFFHADVEHLRHV